MFYYSKKTVLGVSHEYWEKVLTIYLWISFHVIIETYFLLEKVPPENYFNKETRGK